ncbi:hypothetical protein CROQUDRAFT_135531 [Cronartium quercuum f. sp. fusiforme G11]|uniref:NADPH:adrenodoxin oxidoreductase, mitochondrial n=1 Tax=Cronartium quercuum f. sp. fusiforme G11 TaxID=708437 RepID=A0A9P6NF35_9BASI|nr:hypothetical protein CROQUDRAFT_135531 [Cronartium quercuum f. sp. fusiforme G11]
MLSALPSRPLAYHPLHQARRQFRTNTTSRSNKPSLFNRQYKFAICGGGPAGFYSASRLLSLSDSSNIRVHLFEALPTPFGLSRYGVAPDHPEVKNCEHKFEEVAQDPRFQFFGNTRLVGDNDFLREVDVSESYVSISQLRSNYDAVILAYGAGLDRDLGGIPGEKELKHVVPARSVVNWYNRYPLPTVDSLEPFVDLSQIEHVTILGQGNVALDIARILLSSVDSLSKTDISERALENLSRSKVKRVEIVGRRGPLQMSCTTKELRELLSLKDVSFDTDEAILSHTIELIRQPQVLDYLHNARLRRRLLELMSKAVSSKPIQDRAPRSWSFKFLQSPLAFLPDPTAFFDPSASGQLVYSVQWEANQLIYSTKTTHTAPHTDLSTAKAIPSNPARRFITQTDLVIESLGYRSQSIPGIPYDSRQNSVKHVNGRVSDVDGKTMPGLYVAGWLSRGANGVIANTMYDAYLTVDKIAEDALNGQLAPVHQSTHLSSSASTGHPSHGLSWSQWKKIDVEEIKRGTKVGKVREKIRSVPEMIDIANR